MGSPNVSLRKNSLGYIVPKFAFPFHAFPRFIFYNELLFYVTLDLAGPLPNRVRIYIMLGVYGQMHPLSLAQASLLDPSSLRTPSALLAPSIGHNLSL